jgi:hypothetical protein
MHVVKPNQAPVVRHSYAADPNPEKVRAALDLWRRALVSKMVRIGRPKPVEEVEVTAGE